MPSWKCSSRWINIGKNEALSPKKITITRKWCRHLKNFVNMHKPISRWRERKRTVNTFLISICCCDCWDFWSLQAKILVDFQSTEQFDYKSKCNQHKSQEKYRTKRVKKYSQKSTKCQKQLYIHTTDSCKQNRYLTSQMLIYETFVFFLILNWCREFSECLRCLSMSCVNIKFHLFKSTSWHAQQWPVH